MRLDGVLDEPAWAAAPSIETLTMSEPIAGGKPSATTTVRVLADSHALVIGIVCFDRDPSRIVSFTQQWDAALDSEDNVTIVLDTFMDDRSGNVFKVNPSGARYEALINPSRSDVNSNWDGIWDAATHRGDRGWSVEIWIPLTTIGFKTGLSWHFKRAAPDSGPPSIGVAPEHIGDIRGSHRPQQADESIEVEWLLESRACG